MKIKNIVLLASSLILSFSSHATEEPSQGSKAGFSALLKQFEGGKPTPIPPANSSPTAAKSTSPTLVKTAPNAVKRASPLMKRAPNAQKQSANIVVAKVPAQKSVSTKRASNHAAPVPAHTETAQPPVTQLQQRKVGSLKRDQDVSKKPGQVQLQEQLANFAYREAMIAECVNQCGILKLPKLTYGQITTACLTLYPLYDQRHENNVAKGIADEACDKIRRSWYFSENSRQQSVSDDKCSRLRHKSIDVTMGADGDHWYELLCGIKADITESMAMYEKFHGKPHPLKDEYLELCAPAQAVAVIPLDNVKEESRSSPPLTASKQQEMDTARLKMLDASITAFKLWTNKSFTQGMAIETFKELIPLYQRRIDILPWDNPSPYTISELTGEKYIFYNMESLIRVTPDFSFKNKVEDYERTDETGKFFRLRKEIREDILAILDLYEKLNGKAHPRKAEFFELDKKAYPKL